MVVRTRRILAVIAAVLLSMSLSAPALADEIEFPVFEAFPDTENGVAVFWNITRDNFCEWAAGGFVGDPPVEKLVTVTAFFQESGVILGHYDAVRRRSWRNPAYQHVRQPW